MFVNRNRFSKLQPTDGAEVIVRGRVSLYAGTPRARSRE